MRNYRLEAVLVVLAVAALGLVAVDGATLAMSHEEGADAQALWEMLQEADYAESWAAYANAPEGFYEGTRPHGALLKTFANETAATHPDTLPAGSIIVKENYTPDEELAAITVMKKIEGYDAENQNWFWVKYTPEGNVAEQEGTKLAGKVQSCIGCHATAAGGDYVYTNDEEGGS